MTRKNIIIATFGLIIVIGVSYFLWTTSSDSSIIKYQDPKLTQEEIKPFLDRITESEKLLSELDPNSSQAERYQLLLKIASEYYPIGELEKSREYYLKASELVPKESLPFYALSTVEVSMHDYKSARKHISQAISLDSKNPEYWKQKIQIEEIYFNASQDEIGKIFSDALTATNSHPDLITAYATYLEKQNDLAGAVAQWKLAIEKNPSGSAQYQAEIARIQNKLK